MLLLKKKLINDWFKKKTLSTLHFVLRYRCWSPKMASEESPASEGNTNNQTASEK